MSGMGFVSSRLVASLLFKVRWSIIRLSLRGSEAHAMCLGKSCPPTLLLPLGTACTNTLARTRTHTQSIGYEGKRGKHRQEFTVRRILRIAYYTLGFMRKDKIGAHILPRSAYMNTGKYRQVQREVRSQKRIHEHRQVQTSTERGAVGNL